jgi:hypothetical protein
MTVNFGRLTAEETAQIVADGIAALNEEDLFRVLNEMLTKEQKSDLAESWQVGE